MLYFGDQGEVLGFADDRYKTPAQHWHALEGRNALTFAHHSASEPVATNWDFAPPSHIEPVTEITSGIGASEVADAPGVVSGGIARNFVRDALVRGYRLGFIGSGDSHDGHPGLSHLLRSSKRGGLAAVLSEDRTRQGVLDALLARRTYATNGPRIWLRVLLDGLPMGTTFSTAAPDSRATQELVVEVEAESELSRIDLIPGDAVLHSVPVNDQSGLSRRFSIRRLDPGEFLYVRVVQRDGGAAWSSPFFAD